MKTSLERLMIVGLVGLATPHFSCREDEEGRHGNQPGGETDNEKNTGVGLSTDSVDSSSVNTGGPSTPDPVWNTGSDTEPGICDEQNFEITGKIVDILIVLDRSESMAASRLWRPMGAALRQVTRETEASVNYGLLTFPFTEEDCNPGDILLDIAPYNAAAIGDVVGGGAHDVGTAIGTPTAGSLVTAKKYLDFIDSTHEKYVLLANDGAPNCNDDLDPTTCRCSVNVGPGGCAEGWFCLDDAATVAAAAALYDAGYPVFVLGIGDSMQWEDVMNNIAEAGGTGQYIPADSNEFVEVLKEIVGGILSCDFDVDWSTLADDVNHDPNKVNLYCKQSTDEPNNNDINNGNIIPMNADCATGKQGWTWTDDTATTLHMCEETCTAIKEGACPIVSATFGCASIPIL
jgi:hypothetical protein